MKTSPGSVGSGWTNSDLLAFTGGLLLTLTLLAIAILVRQPTDFQYVVFKSAAAIAAGLLAAGLADKVTILSKHVFARITVSAFVIGVFYFLSPAALIADQRKVQVETLARDYNDGESQIRKAVDFLDNRMRQPDIQSLYQGASNPNEEILSNIDNAIKRILRESEASKSFEVELRFFIQLASCVKSGKCDRQQACDVFFKDVESFRHFTCGVIADRDRSDSSQIAQDLEEFSVDQCRTNFINTYVDFRERAFDNICLPTQCWAEHKAPPYPCRPKVVDEG